MWANKTKMVNGNHPNRKRCIFPKKSEIYTRPEPQTFTDGKHRIEYTDEFKYLGCILTPDLLDEKEISKRIKQAKAQTANLSNLFKSKASTWVKI
jgi:hypothetical protein